MKPGDHPDFFRLPPPPGRSRESGIVLDEEGRFWNGPDPLEHAAMAAAFSSWIRRHPDDGRFILSNGYDWTYFTVRDAPFVVRHVSVSGAEVRLHLSDGTEEPLDPSTLSISADGVPYARVKQGAFEARFAVPAQVGLVELLAEGEGGAPEVQVAGQRWPLARRPPSR